jgi:HSP20 family molecular chaperone IbpA
MIPLPGFAKDDIKVSLISDNLNIKAKKDVIKEDEKVNQKKGESFDRNLFISQFFTNLWENGINLDIQMPSNVNTDEITSKMAEGLLQIKVGKQEPKEINIDENSNDYK